MNVTQLLNFLSENSYTRFPKCYKEPYLRTVKTEEGIAIHQIFIDLFFSPLSGDFIWYDNQTANEIELLERDPQIIRVKDFSLMYKAYIYFKKKENLNEGTKLDFCLMLIRLFYKEYSAKTVSNYEKYNNDLNSFLNIVIELQRFNDEALSPVIKDIISRYVYTLVKPLDRRYRNKKYETSLIKVPNAFETEAEYRRYKKTNPLMIPGFVNIF